MRDDLVDGRLVLRLDDLERLEMMAVQLEEASAFLARGTVSHARLAFILLDNAAEVIMRRGIEVRLARQHVHGTGAESVEGDPGTGSHQR